MIKSTQITILFISLFYFQCNGQQLITDITANATEENGKLDDIYQLNVFSYYNLEEYDTELKKSVFKKTTEYQNYLTELKTKKAEMQKTTYYTIKTDMFNDTNYDVKRKGFEIEIGTNSGLGTFTARTPKSIYLENGSRIILKGLPIKQKPEPYVAKGVFSENLFLQISEENGLEKTTFKFYNFDNGRYRGWYTINNNDLKSETVRVIVANKETGFIYFDKFYNYQAMKKK